jgi:2-aminobenzoate-CoA ligase
MPHALSAHVDTFTHDRLPPSGQWADRVFTLPELQYPDRLNCAVELLDGAIERFGADRRCLVTDSEEWTYGQLRDRSNQVAHVLTTQLGLVPGNRVLMRGPTTPWLVAAWFGVLKAGGVVVLTMPLLRAAELVTTIDLTEPTLAICDHRFLDELETARKQTSPDLPVVPFGGTTEDDLISRAATSSVGDVAVATAAEDVALLAPTSGTTGRPKVTMHFHQDVLAIADTFGRHVLKPLPEDRLPPTAPLAVAKGACTRISATSPGW